MIFICIICSLLFLYGFIKYHKAQKRLTELDEITKQRNEEFRKANRKLEQNFHDLHAKRDAVLQELNTISSLLDRERYYLKKNKEDAEQSLRHYLTMYTETLEQAYQEAEDRHDKAVAKLTLEFHNVNAELDKLKATRQATIEAALREKEIKDKLHFYCLTPKTLDLNDIQALGRIKPQLNNPRILSMLIWSTYFQKDMTALCNRILGLNTVTGIYKITNQQNQKCYIGQSVDVSKRWKDHAKCGLGIDTPAGNKLYKDMQEYGIWNFSWELLEACPREQLNEKEKHYINLYQSQDFGYNSTKGNK